MARLPTVGSDNGNWGTILNDFLQTSLNSDGTVKHQFINVKDYGATGDGSTNDTTAITNAVNAAQSGVKFVYFPKGTYRCNLFFSGLSGVRFFGHGRATVLEPHTLSNYNLAIQDSTDITIEGLSFNGRFSGGATASPTFFQDIDGLLIQYCHFDDSKFRAINFLLDNSPEPPRNKYIKIVHCSFENNERDPIYIGNASEVWVTDNLIYDAPDTAIDIGEKITRVIVSNNTILSCQTGIYNAAIRNHCLISNNIILETTGNGISLTTWDVNSKSYVIEGNIIASPIDGSESGSAIVVTAPNGIIANNRIEGFDAHQIRIGGSNTLVTGNRFVLPTANYAISVTAANQTIVGNVFELGQGKGGVLSTVSNIEVKDNTFYTPDPAVSLGSSTTTCHIANNTMYTSRNGVVLNSSSSNMVEGNRFINSVFNTDIVEQNTADSNLFIGNTVRNKFAIVIVGANTKALRNHNFATENTGTATVANGATSVTVTHNMAITPQAKNIHITPTNNMGTATKFWVSDITASQFTINVDVDPGAGTATFAWSIIFT